MLILTDREKSHPSPTHRRSPLLPFNPFSKQLPKESCSMLVGSCQSSAPNPPRVCHRTLRAIRIVRPDLVPTTLSPPLLLLSLRLLCFPPQLSPSLSLSPPASGSGLYSDRSSQALSCDFISRSPLRAAFPSICLCDAASLNTPPSPLLVSIVFVF